MIQCPRWNVTCAHGWQGGGGLYVGQGGTATLTNTNVYTNHIDLFGGVNWWPF